MNSYALPQNAQLLSYWQYQKSAEPPTDTRRIRHQWVSEINHSKIFFFFHRFNDKL